MEEDSILKPLWRNQRDRQEEEWSSPASDGREGRDIPVSCPTVQESQQSTPLNPAPSEDRLFMDWSSIRTGSPLVRMPPQSIPVKERGKKLIKQLYRHPILCSGPTCIGVTENVLQEDSP